MIEIQEFSIDHYIKKLQKGEYFSFSGWSDAEWLAMIGSRIGGSTAAGQIWTKEIGDQLKEALKEAIKQPDIYPAVPKVLLSPDSGVGQGDMSEILRKMGFYNAVFYERDMVTDNLAAKEGGLREFIKQLRQMDVYFVGNVCLKGLHFLKYKQFFETETLYNFHQVPFGIENMVNKILDFGKPGVYLTAVGMSDAVMISKLHGKIPKSFFIDVGSIFDAFVGIGGQREWRANLYADTSKWLSWVNSQLYNL